MKRIDESFDHLEKAKGTNNAHLNSCKRLIYDQIWEAGVRTMIPEEGKAIAEWDTMFLGKGTNAGHIHAALLPLMLFKADLHTVSIKEAIVTNNRNFSKFFSAQDKEVQCYEIVKNECSNMLNIDGLEVLLRNKLVKKYLNDSKPVGMLCYTRAFNLPELSIIFNTEVP